MIFVKNGEGRESTSGSGDWVAPAGQTFLAEVIDVKLFGWPTLGAMALVL